MNLIDPKILTYSEEHSTVPGPHCQDIFQYTQKNHPLSQMLCGPLEGAVLSFLVRLINAKRILEFGTYTGYSSLVMAEATGEGAEVITIDNNPKHTDVAQRFWKNSPHGSKIKLIQAFGAEAIERLEGTFDFVFIDADKKGYLNYLKKSLEMLNPGGLVALDNVLWSGRVLNPEDEQTEAICEVNDWIRDNQNIIGLLLPIRDGLFLVQKKY